jgi:hypothetical protein
LQSGQVIRIVLLVGLGVGLLTGAASFRQVGEVQAQHGATAPVYIPPTVDLNDPRWLADQANRSQGIKDRVKGLNEERQKRLKDDANKLLQLSTELKATVDKSSSDELPVAALRKAAEIEKLAHGMQNRMKN